MIWHYKDTYDGISKLFGRGCVLYKDNNLLNLSGCIFCKVPLQLLKHEDLDPEFVVASINRGQTAKYFLRVYACPMCGWWVITKSIDWHGGHGISRFWYIYDYVAAGSFKRLDLTDISLPLDEVRTTLILDYEKRKYINPFLFEKVVGDVFKDLGYDVEATGHMGGNKNNDHGIDIILRSNKDVIGVQVKRYGDKIEAEQIRSLVGALVLRGIIIGMFVTTSNFREGAYKMQEGYLSGGYSIQKSNTPIYRIELYDSDKFYDALRITQRNMYRSVEEFDLVHNIHKIKMVRIFGSKEG